MDVIELGRPERPERPPRRGWPLGVAALVVLGAVAFGATRNEPRPVASASPSPTAFPTIVPPLETVDPDAVPSDPQEVPDSSFEGEWSLPDLTEHTGLVVTTASEAMVAMNLDTQRVTRVHVPGEASGVTIDPVTQIPGGGWLVFSRAICGEICSAPLYAVRGRTTTLVTDGIGATLDTDGRTVWVTGVDGEVDTNPGWVDRYTFTGSRIGPRTTLRPGEYVQGVTPDSLVLAAGRDGGVVLVDRTDGSRHTVLHGRVPVAVSGYQVATVTDGCYAPYGNTCDLRVTDVRSGRSRVVTTIGNEPAAVAMDPTARYVAVTNVAPVVAVRVYDVAGAKEVPIRGLDVPPAAATVSWSPDGKWLVLNHPISNGSTIGSRIAVWRPGLSRPLAVPSVYPREGIAVVVGVAG